MRLETNLSCAIATALVGTTMLFSNSASGQCSVTPPPGTIVTTDGCEHLDGAIDTNGGCNSVPAAFTDLGVLASGATMYVSGQMGLYIPTGSTTYTSRDLDWMLVTCAAGTVQVSLTTQNSTATGQMPNSQVFIKKNVGVDPCLGNFDVAIQSTACPHAQSIVSGAGQHLIVVTVPFDTTAAETTTQACGTYLLTISHAPFTNPICGTSTESCTEVHASGGCNLPACCEDTCNFNPLCCEIGWDQGCVDQAVTGCGLFIYSCSATAGAPANDCATSSQLITVGQANVIADNTNAGSDGPNDLVCGSTMGKDLWYTIKAPANGALTFSVCASGTDLTDSVLAVYNLGTDPVMTAARAQTLPSLYKDCNEDCSATNFASGITLIDAVANNYYMFRIGGFVVAGAAPSTAVIFSLPVATSFEEVVFTTGAQQAIVTTATGALGNLGLSSGCLSAASQQRWMAQPFSVPASAPSFNVSRITVKGFVPAGSINETLNYVVWSRAAGNPAPVASNQVVAGSVPFPVAYDTAADSAATASHDIVSAFNLPAGNYYLTAYASNAAADCVTSPANFAWFICAYDGINLIDATGAPFNWRSANFPTAGFVKYTALNGVYNVQPGADPNDLYNTAFDIYGTSVLPVACPGDFNNDGFRNGADLATMLSAWGTPGGDINGDNTTNGADLTGLLSGWGNCPI
jgi:hypothetical protein